MAPDPIITERVYHGLKAQILKGAFSPGARIEAQVVAAYHGTSVTPVREAMNRLVGERLLEVEPRGGIRAPATGEAALRDLYAWNAQLALLALRSAPPETEFAVTRLVEGIVEETEATDIVSATASLFASIAAAAGNGQHSLATEAVNDHLHAARLAELHLIRDARQEIVGLAQTIQSAPRQSRARGIWTYHRRRMGRVADLARLLKELPVTNPRP
jgi:DNA-binding GntR family transcriptional regulator